MMTKTISVLSETCHLNPILPVLTEELEGQLEAGYFGKVLQTIPRSDKLQSVEKELVFKAQGHGRKHQLSSSEISDSSLMLQYLH